MSIIKDLKRKGGLIFGVIPDGPEGDGCANCNASGYLGVQYLEGPHNDPTGKKVTSYKNKWYTPHTTMYPCPVCGGSGR